MAAIAHTSPLLLSQRSTDDQVERSYRRFSNLRFLSYLLDAIPDTYVILNEHRQVVFANQSLADLLHAESREALLGSRPGELLCCQHAHETPGGCGTTPACRMCGAFRAIMQGMNQKKASEDCRILRDNGEALDLRVWTTPLQIGDETYCIFAMKDISDEKRRAALEQTFFHDLLNTAGILSTYTQILERAPSEAHAIASELSQVAQRLVNEIFAQKDIIAAEDDALAVHPEPINPLALCQQIAGEYERSEVAYNRHIIVEGGGTSRLFISDPVLLGRVLGNMLKNALEASKPHDAVRITYDIAGGLITFQVHNSGVIPMNVQLQLFQRSFSTKGPGRGLGTYSMKLLSEKYLHGHVDFISSKEEGTTFRAMYPLLWKS